MNFQRDIKYKEVNFKSYVQGDNLSQGEGKIHKFLLIIWD